MMDFKVFVNTQKVTLSMEGSAPISHLINVAMHKAGYQQHDGVEWELRNVRGYIVDPSTIAGLLWDGEPLFLGPRAGVGA